MSLQHFTLPLAPVFSDAAHITRAWELPVHPFGTEPTKERALTAYLLTEEVAELAEAISRADLIETLDALVDTAYVTAGSMVRHGLADGIDGNWDVPVADLVSVQAATTAYLSALTERRSPERAREAGLLLILSCAGAAAVLGCGFAPLWDEVHRSNMTKLVNGRPVKNPETGKVMKPDTYCPPDLASVVESEEYAVPGQWQDQLI